MVPLVLIVYYLTHLKISLFLTRRRPLEAFLPLAQDFFKGLPRLQTIVLRVHLQVHRDLKSKVEFLCKTTGEKSRKVPSSNRDGLTLRKFYSEVWFSLDGYRVGCIDYCSV